MPDYRLYHFDGTRLLRAETLPAADDSEAITKAEQRVDGKLAELWRGGRKVRIFNPDGI